MTISLPSVVASACAQKDMRHRSDVLESGWTFWEKRNINIHRVVGLARVAASDARSLDVELRGAFARNFKRAWWRGIAYGVVADVGTLQLPPDDLKVLVDAYENNTGTMQWVVLLNGQQATGVHTWIEGFLSPVYRDVLGSLSQGGCTISSAMKEKDGLLKFLTAVGGAQTRVLTGRTAFPDFVDPFNKKDQ